MGYDTLDIDVPIAYVELCEHWHSGQSDLLYAISSTGNLTIGNRRPLGCDTDQKWQLDLFRTLSIDIACARRAAIKTLHHDYRALCEFDKWCDTQIAWLEEKYGLADWENVA